MNADTTQPDLFGEAALAGLSQASDIVTPSEERRLIAAIDAQDLSPFRFHGWLGKRLTVSHGWRYVCDEAGFARPDATPEGLLALREKAAGFARLEPVELVQAL